MEIEKEIRFKIESDSKIKEIELETEEIQEKSETIDLVLGWKGFESLDKYGFICRVRKKNDEIYLECKKKIKDNIWNESKIKLKEFREGVNFLSLIGMKPYLYINRKRQIRKYKDLKIYIDEVDMLGSFIEIEFQKAQNEKEQIQEFLSHFNIKNIEQKLYGDIFKEKIETDINFKAEFERKMKYFINNDIIWWIG